MALAILELVGDEGAAIRFRIDTGTNRVYRFKIGRSVRRRNGLDWVDNVYFTSPLQENPTGGSLLSSWTEISIPVARFEKGNAYVQLFSFKNEQGKSPGFSQVVSIPTGIGRRAGGPSTAPLRDFAQDVAGFGRGLSVAATMNAGTAFQPVRRIPCRTVADTYAVQASWGDILTEILKVAGPIVQNLLGSQKAGGAGGAAGSGGDTNQTNLLSVLLKTLLGGLGQPAAPVSGQPAPVGGQPAIPVGQAKSLLGAELQINRFDGGGDGQFAQPFFWQAILQAVAGELVKIAPQLMNMANQRKLGMKALDNKLVTDALSEVNRKILMEQLLKAQQGGQAGGTPDLNQLIQLLQGAQGAAPEAAPSPAVAPQSLGAAQSLWAAPAMAFTLSSKAVLSFVTAPPIAWQGADKVLFARGGPLLLRVRFTVAEPAPKQPLPKAILRVVFKDSANEAIFFEKHFKLKDVAANAVLSCAFSPEETAKLPGNKPVLILAELRWLSPKTGREIKALGSSEIVLVGRFFLKDGGAGRAATRAAARGAREPADLQQFRPFWNKIWDSPSLDAAGARRNGDRKTLWELDANARYTVLLSPGETANGLMETRLLAGPPDGQSLSARTEGRMKAGIELSIAELGKLASLWDGEPILDQEKVEAFGTAAFAARHGGEFVHRLRLKGRAAERGMVWVTPVCELFDFALSSVRRADDAGQVVEVAEEQVAFPVPVAARVLGLKSTRDESAEEDESGDTAGQAYHFAGYEVVFSEKVALIPPQEMRKAADRQRVTA